MAFAGVLGFRGVRRSAAAALCAAAVLVATAAPAVAHTELESSDPAEGTTLAAAPATVRLTFGAAVTLPPDPITVTGPDGSRWTVGVPAVAGQVVTAPVEPVGPAGAYRLDYTVLADDGDTVSGAVRFTLSAPVPTPAPITTTTTTTATTTAPPSAAPAAQPAASEDDPGTPVWVWVLVAAVLVAAVAFGVVRSRRAA